MNGLPMVEDHLDPEKGAGKHDENQDCVMYRALEELDGIDAIAERLTTGGPPIELDAACLADIQAVIDAG